MSLIHNTRTSFRWTVKMAWRDSRKNRGKLLLFIASISLGIAALVGITSFRENLLQELDVQSKSLLGADFSVKSNEPLPDSLYYSYRDLTASESFEVYFASMIYFPRTDGSRLVQVRALTGDYPYYGRIETIPIEAAIEFKTGQFAIVDEKLMIQFNVEIGDSIQVGRQSFAILGSIKKIPGQTDMGASVSPVVYIPYQYAQSTELLQRGSRVNYVSYFQFHPKIDTTNVWSALVEKSEKSGYSVETIEDRKNETGRSFKDLSAFLQIIAFTALLLGCLGVAGAIHVYLKSKVQTVAILRCMGMKARQAIDIYLIQVIIFGAIGAAIGCIGGLVIHLYLPVLAASFIPIDLVPTVYWPAIVAGLFLGIGVSFLFGMLSLVKLRLVSPLSAIRINSDSSKSRFDGLQLVIGLFIFIFVFAAQYWLIQNLKEAAINTGILLLSIALLFGIALGVIYLVRRFTPKGIPYVWRQGLSNLHRPNNQTAILILTLGLGTAFLGMLYFMQDMLVQQVTIAGSGERPNTVLFDIQSDQKESISKLTVDYELPVIQEVPVVTMRLLSINGKDKVDFENDTTAKMPDWAFNREYRVTYRENLIDSEKITDGRWVGKVNQPGDSILISIAKGYAENLDLKIGDELLFNVQGALMKTYIGSFRDVDWRRVQTNFLVLFPTGILEKAPQFHVLITRVGSNDISARFQRAVVRFFPNVSVIDLELILKTVEELLGKVAFIIQFMALFSIATGFIVMISAIMLSKYQRMQENVLLRTLGASRKQLWQIIAVEYFMLGALGTIAGLLLATLFTTLLGKFVFEFVFIPNPLHIIVIFITITTISMLVGLFNSRSIVSQTPLEVLRKEV